MTDEMAGDVLSALGTIARDMGELRRSLGRIENHILETAEAVARIEKALTVPAVIQITHGGVVNSRDER